MCQHRQANRLNVDWLSLLSGLAPMARPGWMPLDAWALSIHDLKSRGAVSIAHLADPHEVRHKGKWHNLLPHAKPASYKLNPGR